MNDLNKLRQRIGDAIPCEEYERVHPGYGADGYENAGNHAAKILLRIAAGDPKAFKAALDSFRNDPYGHEIDSLMTPGELSILFGGRFGLTGFQWGWAVNAVAHLLEQEAVPNPAVMQISPKGGLTTE